MAKPVTNKEGPAPAKLTRGRKCSICVHKQRADIDLAIVQGMEPKEITRQFAVSQDSILRHRRDHLPTPAMAAGVQAALEEEQLSGAGLVQRVARLLTAAEEMLGEARSDRDRIGAAAMIREAGRCAQLLAKMAGDIDTSTTINIQTAPAVLQLQQLVMMALSGFPEARAAVCLALAPLAGGGSAPRTIEYDPAG